MKISTAEIKMLIKECVKKEGVYTAKDFKNYILANTQKEVTQGQIAGGISQLVDSKAIIRIERGLYEKYKEPAQSISGENEEKNKLKAELYDTLNKVEKELVNAIGKVNVWDLNEEDFELIKQIRELKSSITQIKFRCK